MVHMSRTLKTRRNLRVRAAGTLLLVGLVVCGQAAIAAAQAPVHYQHAGAMPPGAIGSLQLQRGGPLPGYFQPIEIRAPQGTMVAMAEQSGFGEPQPTPIVTGLLIAPVYRLRVINIPMRPGFEVYPTIELVNRVYPPVGLEARFPVPIELTQQELEMALDGKFVTRVIYVENPETALPMVQDPRELGWFEVAAHDNPLEVADRLGRPIAILRIGGRVPVATEAPDAAFMFGSPPFLRYHPTQNVEVIDESDEVISGPVAPSMTPEEVAP